MLALVPPGHGQFVGVYPGLATGAMSLAPLRLAILQHLHLST